MIVTGRIQENLKKKKIRKKRRRKLTKIKVQFQIINMDRLLYKYYIFWIMHFCTHLLNSCFIFLFLCIRITIVTLWLDHIRKILPNFSSRVCALKKFGPQETEIPKFWPWRVLLWLQLPERLLVANILSPPPPPPQSMWQGSKAALHFH